MVSSREPSDHEKEILAALEGHDADTPSNEGYILDAHGEATRRKSLAERRASNASKNGHAKNGDIKDSSPERKEEGLVGKEGDLENGKEEDGGQEDETNVVWWDGDDDPQNPLNWSTWRKAVNVTLVSTTCFVVPLASSMFAPGVPALMAEFHSSSSTLGAFVVSVYVLGFAFGPLILAPMSELYGRVIVFHVTNVLFVIFSAVCALSTNLSMLIVFRFFAGTVGAAPLTNGSGSIADMIHQKDRGAVMASFVIGPLLGPVIGPVAGGFLADAKGWRWVFWLLTIFSGGLTILCFVFMRETNAVTILEKKTKRLQKSTGNMELRSKLDIGLSPKDLFFRSIVRPMKMLFTSPIVAASAIYMGIVYGYLYLLFTTFTLVFEDQYGFNSSSVGLTYLGLGIGNLIGLGLFGAFSDRIIKKNAVTVTNPDGSTTTSTKPEYRLPPAIPIAVLLPIGFFIYGWTAQYQIQYIVPIFGTLLIGLSNIVIFMAIQTYLVDSFTIYAASAMAANGVVRSIFGTFLPLGGQSMYNVLGLGWGNSLLAFIAVLCIPLPWGFFTYGERLRTRFAIKNL